MSFLLSLLGIGKMLREWAGIAFKWALASSTHLLMVACALLAAWGWIGWHKAHKAEKVLHSTEIARQADNDAWAAADKINHGTIDGLIATLNDQSKAIQGWADTTNARQNAAQAALRAATARGVAAEASAQRIEAERATGCHSGAAVLQSRGDL